MTQPLAIITPSTPRRAIATLVLTGIGAMLISVGISETPSDAVWRGILLICGGLSFAAALKLWRATSDGLVLTAESLADTQGRVLCHCGDIAGLDRGTFALKPSNGFVLRLRGSMPLGWAPGVWWRIGSRLGIGGVLPADQTKFMAQVIAGIVAARSTPTQD